MPSEPIAQCVTCGVERPSGALPAVCPICADERQYVPVAGQRWTTPREQSGAGTWLEPIDVEPDVHGLVLHDGVGIGQQALLIGVPGGNVMVEPPAHIDDEAIAAVRGLGGLQAIIASHPHMYGVQSLWSDAFGGVPAYISEADQEWLAVRPARTVVWSAEIEIAPGVVASQPGGHFPGSAVVHWTAPDGRGVLFSGDTIAPVPDPGWVTFLRSFPNLIPLSGTVVRRVAEHVARYDFDRPYGNFGGTVPRDARTAVLRSADRYARWVSGEFDHLT